VRELHAMVLDVVTRATTAKIHVSAFKELILREKGGEIISFDQENDEDNDKIIFYRFPTLKQAENELIRRAMEITNNNQGLAAQKLGVTRQALNNRLRRNKK
jgi:DNA-binding NtrC family response regulator